MKIAFLKGFKLKKIPLLTEKSESAWPSRYPLHVIQDLKQRVGPYIFATQMMLDSPLEQQNGFFNANLLHFYADDLVYREVNQSAFLHLGGINLVSGIAYWDPALGHLDSSVVASVFQDDKGFYYVHDVLYLKIDKKEDSAAQQSEQVIAFLQKNYLNHLMIETNGIGAFLPEIFRQHAQKSGFPVSVQMQQSRTKKSDRIISTLDPLVGAGFLKLHISLQDSPWVAEFKYWAPDNKMCLDDGLDAVCGAILAKPVRIRRRLTPLFENIQKKWKC